MEGRGKKGSLVEEKIVINNRFGKIETFDMDCGLDSQYCNNMNSANFDNFTVII